MNEFDDSIRKALQEDEELLMRDPSLFDQIGESMRGRNAWMVVGVFVMITVLTAFAVYCGYQHFFATWLNGAERMMWGMSMMFCALIIAMLKIWYWMELNKNTVLREVKRLELQVARLADSKEG